MTNAPLRIIGIGNPLMGDDGLGIAVIEQLQQHQLPPCVELIDGGCGGLSLVPLLTECRLAIIIDAADFGANPGSIKTLTTADLSQIPAQIFRPSSHQPGLADVLQLLKKLNELPQLTMFFMQVANCRQGYGLSGQVRAALPDLIAEIRRVIPPTV